MQPIQPHQSLATPTTEVQRASAISSLGEAPPRPVMYAPPPMGYPPQQMMYAAPQMGYPPQQQMMYAPQPMGYPPQQQMMVAQQQQQLAAQQQQQLAAQQHQQQLAAQAAQQQQLAAQQQQQQLAAQQAAEQQKLAAQQAAQQKKLLAQQQQRQQQQQAALAQQQRALAAQQQQQQAQQQAAAFQQPAQPAALLPGWPTTPQPQTPVSAPPSAAPGDDWGLDGLDLGPPSTSTAAQPTNGAAEKNDWPAPEGVDPEVWGQLPAHMQRELLMQQGVEGNGSGVAGAAPPPRSSAPRAVASASDGGENTVIEVLARISARTLRTKAWKPSIAVVKGNRELLIFRSMSDWIAYRNANVHSTNINTDLVKRLKAVQELVKLQVRFTSDLRCTPIKAKSYKSFGYLHHFTLELANGSVVAKLASTTEPPLFQLRSAITLGCRAGLGIPEHQDTNTYGRYATGDVSP